MTRIASRIANTLIGKNHKIWPLGQHGSCQPTRLVVLGSWKISRKSQLADMLTRAVVSAHSPQPPLLTRVVSLDTATRVSSLFPPFWLTRPISPCVPTTTRKCFSQFLIIQTCSQLNPITKIGLTIPYTLFVSSIHLFYAKTFGSLLLIQYWDSVPLSILSTQLPKNRIHSPEKNR